MITYATKVWEKEFVDTINRHPKANLIIANNMKRRIVDIGDTDDFYFEPELEAVRQCSTEYLLWYAGDVIPPETDWVKEALPLLEKYPIVTCQWDNSPPVYAVKETDFGWENYHFSDHCYIAKAEVMRGIDYTIDHPIKADYPAHGKNSFERRVAQWLAHNQTPMAVLKNHHYLHIPNHEKSL